MSFTIKDTGTPTLCRSCAYVIIRVEDAHEVVNCSMLHKNLTKPVSSCSSYSMSGGVAIQTMSQLSWNYMPIFDKNGNEVDKKWKSPFDPTPNTLDDASPTTGFKS